MDDDAPLPAGACEAPADAAMWRLLETAPPSGSRDGGPAWRSVRRPATLLVTYETAWQDADGLVHFRRDPDHRDRLLVARLQRAVPGHGARYRSYLRQ